MMAAKPQLKLEPERKPITDWVLRIGVAFFFVAVGLEKFSTNLRSEWIKIFEQIGWGQWFRYFTGVVEMLGALLMLVPKATPVGTGLLASAMTGAILAHCFKLGDPFSSIIPLVLLVLILAIGWKLSHKPEEFTHLEL
jgi:putative oxidoreductase